MGVCAVATPVRDAVGAIGALTVEVSAVRFREREDAHRAARCCASATWRTAPCSERRAPPQG